MTTSLSAPPRMHVESENTSNISHYRRSLPPASWLEAFPYDSCVASNEPTPLELAREKLPSVLQSPNHPLPQIDNKRLKVFVNHILVESSCIRTQSPPLSLRELQVQIMLRLELSSLAGETFLGHHAHMVRSSIQHQTSSQSEKRNRRRCRQLLKQRKSMSHRQVLVEEVRELLSLAVFRLHANTPFSTFCKDSLPQHLFTTIPTILQEILDMFEIQNPWEQAEKTGDQAMSQFYLSPVKPPPKRKSVIAAATTEQDDNDNKGSTKQASTASNENPACQNLLNNMNIHTTIHTKSSGGGATIQALVQQPSLTANLTTTKRQKRNSLLKDGGKPRLLASHFNTKLSNVSTLFRQVQMTVPPPKPKPQQQPPPLLRLKPKPPPNHNNNGLVRNHSGTSKRKLLVPPQNSHHVTNHNNSNNNHDSLSLKRSKTEPIITTRHKKNAVNGIAESYTGESAFASPVKKSRCRARSDVGEEEEEGSPRVVYETPLKSSQNHHRRCLVTHSNCIVQETPTKDVKPQSTTTAHTNTSPMYWDRAKVLAEASQVLRRNQRKDDLFW